MEQMFAPLKAPDAKPPDPRHDRELSMDERVARLVVEQTRDGAKLMAQSYARPPGSEKVSDEEELRRWNLADPTFDEAGAWREHILAGTDPWDARTDIARRKYPLRFAMMPIGRPLVKEQIDWANAMAKKAEAAYEREHGHPMPVPDVTDEVMRPPRPLPAGPQYLPPDQPPTPEMLLLGPPPLPSLPGPPALPILRPSGLPGTPPQAPAPMGQGAQGALWAGQPGPPPPALAAPVPGPQLPPSNAGPLGAPPPGPPMQASMQAPPPAGPPLPAVEPPY